MELLEKLGINWQLLLAQTVNFLIVVGVLGYFVYKPILHLLDSRTERIRKSVEDAKRIENQMKEFVEIREREMRRIDQETGVLFDRARKQAEAVQETMLATAKKEAEAIMQNATKRIEQDRRAMMDEVLKSVQRVVLKMTEKILEREFSAADQKRITESLVKDLPRLLS
jgi:F-type H+-transporting ATPase subunit b